MSNIITHDSIPLQPTTDSPDTLITRIDTTPKPMQRDLRSSITSTNLDVPSFRRQPTRRPSSDSILSSLSELSYLSHEFHDTLSRRISNNSIFSSTSSASSSSSTSPNGTPHLHRRRSWRRKLHALYVQNYGALLVVISQFFGSGMNVATRLLEQPGPHGPPMHPFQILFTRQSLTVILCTAYALITKSIPHFPLGPPVGKVRLLLVCRGFCGFFGVFGMYFSLLYLPLSEATVLTFLAPILTCYLCSVVIAGQGFSRQQQIAGLVSLCGVVFIARPISLFAGGGGGGEGGSGAMNAGAEGGILPDSTMVNVAATAPDGPTVPTPEQHLLAIGIAMLGVIGATGALTSIRAIGTRAHAFVSINYFSVMSSIVSLFALLLIPSVSFRFPGNVQEWILLLSLGVCGFCMQGLLTMGLAYNGPAAHSVKEVVSQHAATNTEGDIELQNRPGPSTTKSPRRSKKSKTKIPSGSGTRATSMLYTQMLFALSADRIFFGSVPDVWSWIGSGLILAGAIWVAAARDTIETGKDKTGTGEQAGVNEVESSGMGLLTRVKSGTMNGDARREDVDGEVGEEHVGLLTGEAEVEGDDDLDDRLRR